MISAIAGHRGIADRADRERLARLAPVPDWTRAPPRCPQRLGDVHDAVRRLRRDGDRRAFRRDYERIGVVISRTVTRPPDPGVTAALGSTISPRSSPARRAQERLSMSAQQALAGGAQAVNHADGDGEASPPIASRLTMSHHHHRDVAQPRPRTPARSRASSSPRRRTRA